MNYWNYSVLGKCINQKNLYIVYGKKMLRYEVHVITQNIPFIISVITSFGTDNC